MTTTLIWLAFGALAVLGGFGVRRRIDRSTLSGPPKLDDRDVERIERSGRLYAEEEPPLDLDEIEEAEDRFWSERWDEPDEW